MNLPLLNAGPEWQALAKRGWPFKALLLAVQQPLHWSALGEVMGVPAWKSLPSWFMVMPKFFRSV